MRNLKKNCHFAHGITNTYYKRKKILAGKKTRSWIKPGLSKQGTIVETCLFTNLS